MVEQRFGVSALSGHQDLLMPELSHIPAMERHDQKQ
jgi:hypothetical protein